MPIRAPVPLALAAAMENAARVATSPSGATTAFRSAISAATQRGDPARRPREDRLGERARGHAGRDDHRVRVGEVDRRQLRGGESAGEDGNGADAWRGHAGTIAERGSLRRMACRTRQVLSCRPRCRRGGERQRSPRSPRARR
jgi:hypothetical protein